MAAAELKSDFKLITDTPYLALAGELWGVYYDKFEENWPRYNGTALYQEHIIVGHYSDLYLFLRIFNHLLHLWYG